MAVAANRLSIARLIPVGMSLVLAACASSGSSGGHGHPQPAAPVASGGVTDASYDWHVLMLLPFGQLLKASPLPLHEVLLFHDEATRSEIDNKDCYSMEGAPPRFLGQPPDVYLLCFDHDRLGRVEATVRLAAAEAPQVFARACASWLKDSPAAVPGNTCEGRDGGTAFSARLAAMPGEPAATVSMTLTDASSRQGGHDAAAEH